MLIARQKKRENIAEYLLYMWQIEDIIRACQGDMKIIQRRIIAEYRSLSPETSKTIYGWYENLCEMMRIEGVMERGHLQINKNILVDLSDLHQRILKSSREPFYSTTFFNALPYIEELRVRSGKSDAGDLEVCFHALYGILLLRLQKRVITPETERAMGHISRFVALLAEKYKQENEGKLEL